MTAVVPRRLRAGDRVRVVSPASIPDEAGVERGMALLRSWGLVPELGEHVFDRLGHYLAGGDDDRLADLDDAFRDPGVRAILTTRGGKGSYRIADKVDFDAARADPKPVVGYSDISVLQLSLWHHARVGSMHGPYAAWDDYYGPLAAAALRRALMTDETLVFRRRDGDASAKVNVDGRAEGVLMGGNLGSLALAVGWCCPSFDGAILLIEACDSAPGAMDRALTQLIKSGCLDGLRGVALGEFIRSAEVTEGKWSYVDILLDHFAPLGCPCSAACPSATARTPSRCRWARRRRWTPPAGRWWSSLAFAEPAKEQTTQRSPSSSTRQS